MGVVVKVEWPYKARTACGGYFFDLATRGYDVEVYTSERLAQERVERLETEGIKASVQRPDV